MTRMLTILVMAASLISLRPAVTYAATSPMYNLSELRRESGQADGNLARKALANLEDPKALAMLEKMGISKAEARQRIAGLSDAEIERVVNGQEIRAGGDILYLVLMVVLIIFVAKRI